MVKGLAIFTEHFKGFSDQYIIIGATACSLAFDQRDLEFRMTKDIDIVLIVEALTPDFIRSFWDFIKAGGYRNLKKSSGSPQFYRFDKPQDNTYPYMIELFSRKPDIFDEEYTGKLAPIPVSDELSSLSAILLDEDYYRFILSGRYLLAGLPCLKPEYLIVLKAKAWIDLKLRRDNGEAIDRSNISKHKNDILRLYQTLEPEIRLNPGIKIQNDMRLFIEQLRQANLNLQNLKILRTTPQDIIARLISVYSL